MSFIYIPPPVQGGSSLLAHFAHGSANFGGAGNPTTLSFPDMGGTDYSVSITPSEDTGNFLGEVWVADKTSTSCLVFNGGDATTSFDWEVKN